MTNLELRGRDTSIRVPCHRLARDSSTLMVVGATGSSSALKALRAYLHEPTKKQRLSSDDYYSLHLSECGYRIFSHRLAPFQHELLAIADDPHLVLDDSEAGLWAVLTGEQFTTPMLRDWIPWVRGELLRKKFLRTLDNHACPVAYLKAATNELDALVSAGIRAGLLEFKEERRELAHAG